MVFVSSNSRYHNQRLNLTYSIFVGETNLYPIVVTSWTTLSIKFICRLESLSNNLTLLAFISEFKFFHSKISASGPSRASFEIDVSRKAASFERVLVYLPSLHNATLTMNFDLATIVLDTF